ncbi:MAG: hypothetical protein ACKN9D_13465 [Actinomycetales bacterium]
MTASSNRPAGVTLVGLLIILVGLAYVVLSVLGLIYRGTEVAIGLGALLVSLAVGIIYLLVAKGIFNGNKFSRFLVSLFTVIGLLGGLTALIFASVTNNRVEGAIQAGISVVILLLLHSRRAKQFFG